MPHGPRLTALAETLPATVPFVGPEAQERAQGFPFKARLGANENVFGPSPRAVAAMAEASEGIWMYGDPENHDLRAALAAHHGVAPANIMVGEGIDGLLGYLVRLTVDRGDRVVTSQGAYPTFNYHVAGFGGELVTVPYRDDREDLPAVMRYALEPGPAPGKPIFAVVILDVGQAGGGLAPDALAALGLPITVAVSPTDPDAASRAAQYRDAGFEVAILAPNLPQGANAADMEVSYQGYVSILPETVALIGQPDAEFQSNSRAAEHLAALLAADGRGLVSYARGLDPAGRAADKEGIPHAAIYRVLDAEHESPTTIGRYLDRAAFEADQTGQVLVVGHSYPETVAALKDWAAAGAKGTAIGPVTAAMLSGRPLN